ncbi:MAG TPA: aldo/keto reductase [Acidimicrobiales bacterium]
MQFSKELRRDVAAGDITVTFRLWRRPQAKVGGRYAVGPATIEVDTMELLPFSRISGTDVRRAGERDRESLRARRPCGAHYRRDPALPDCVPRGRVVNGSGSGDPCERPAAPDEEGLMQQRPIGNRTVSAIGLGEMPLSIEGRPDRRQAIATIHASLDAGVTIIDTADAYSLGVQEHGHGEELVAEALAAYGGPTDDVLVATKGGHRRPGDGSWTVHGDPAYVKEACEASLKALGVDAIGLYQYHRPDPSVPWAESVGALADLLDEGKILMAGVSNATVDQIDEAQSVLSGRLVSVQNEFSPRFRSSENELEHCEKLGIVFIPWSPMGGIGRSDRIQETFPAFAEVATEVGASPQQVTLAWMLAKGSRVIPIPGSSRPETAIASAAAADITLTPEQVARLDAS